MYISSRQRNLLILASEASQFGEIDAGAKATAESFAARAHGRRASYLQKMDRLTDLAVGVVGCAPPQSTHILVYTHKHTHIYLFSVLSVAFGFSSSSSPPSPTIPKLDML